MPPSCTINNEMRANAAVTEMLPVAVALQGTRPIRLHVRIKKNTVSKYGKYRLPSSPMAGTMTSSRRNTTMVSNTLAKPEGTSDGFRKARLKINTKIRQAIHMITKCLVIEKSIPKIEN